MRTVLVVLALALGAAPVLAERVNAAVAANFTVTAEALAAAFAEETGHEVVLSFGSTGQLYAQATQGAPFDVFLSADDERPARLVEDGLGVEGTVFTYAIGTLALYSSVMDVTSDAALAGDFERLAIADPETAPYGRAAIETLTALGLLETLTPRVVTGENITQTLQFVASGNAELGFVALSQVIAEIDGPRVWVVPEALHEPIAQDAVLLTEGADNPAAREFLEFLRSETGVALIVAGGYAVP